MDKVRNKTRQLYEDYCDLTGCRAALSVKDFVFLRREAIREIGALSADAYGGEVALMPQQTPPPAQGASDREPAPVYRTVQYNEAGREPVHLNERKGNKTESAPAPMSDLDILQGITDPWNS